MQTRESGLWQFTEYIVKASENIKKKNKKNISTNNEIYNSIYLAKKVSLCEEVPILVLPAVVVLNDNRFKSSYVRESPGEISRTLIP